MKIFIDASGIVDKTTGVGQYSYRLISNLAKIDDKNQYSILLQNKLSPDHKIFNIKNSNFEFHTLDIPAIGIKRQINYKMKIKNNFEYDLYHCLNSNYPLCKMKNGVVTIHDLKYIKYPEYFGKFYRFKKFYLNSIFKNAVKNSEKVISVSNNTKKDILNYYGSVNENKIDVIYEASNLEFKDREVDLNNKYGVEKPYFLFVGEHRPHKNIIGLLKSFDRFRKISQRDDYHLVITGKTHRSFVEDIKNLGLRKNVIFTGFVDEKDLPVLYREAFCFVLISLYEGFGLPILEAMQAEIPVITSNISSMAELADEGAILVNPDDCGEVAEKMASLVEDNKLYEKYIRKAKERIKNFSWKKTAEQTLKVYKDVYSN